MISTMLRITLEKIQVVPFNLKVIHLSSQNVILLLSGVTGRMGRELGFDHCPFTLFVSYAYHTLMCNFCPGPFSSTVLPHLFSELTYELVPVTQANLGYINITRDAGSGLLCASKIWFSWRCIYSLKYKFHWGIAGEKDIHHIFFHKQFFLILSLKDGYCPDPLYRSINRFTWYF